MHEEGTMNRLARIGDEIVLDDDRIYVIEDLTERLLFLTGKPFPVVRDRDFELADHTGWVH
jgi:hypothetical protein